MFSPAGGGRPYAILLCGLIALFYGGIAAVWLSGDGALYTRLAAWWGVRAVNIPGHWYAPGPLPFFDLAGVLSWRDCHILGFDVLRQNPCDPLGRPANYLPLWLHLPLEWIGVRHTLAAGAVLGVGFLASLPFVMRPAGLGEFLLAALACLSHVVFFAVERANVDVLMFLLMLGAVSLWRRRRNVAAFVVIMLGAFLKLYPCALLALMLREKPWRLMAFAAASPAAMNVYAFLSRHEFALAMPRVFYFDDNFGAMVFPIGLVRQLHLPVVFFRPALALGILASMGGAIVVARHFERAMPAPDWTERRMSLLLGGALIITACFYFQASVDYRAIFLLPVLPGLLALRHASREKTFARLLALGVAATLFCLYSDIVLNLVFGLSTWLGQAPDPMIENLPLALCFFLREAVWWFEATLLMGVVLRFARQSPALIALRGALFAPREAAA